MIEKPICDIFIINILYGNGGFMTENQRNPKKYKDYMFTKTLRYALGIVATLYFLFLVFITLNAYVSVLYSVKSKEKEITEFLNGIYGAYSSFIEESSQGNEIRKATEGDLDAQHQANQVLYDFCNSQTIRANFILAKANGAVVATNLYNLNSEAFEESQLSERISASLAHDPEKEYVTTNNLYYGSYQTGSVILSRSVTDLDGMFCGFLVMDLRYADLYDYFRQYNLSRIVITDRYNNILMDTEYASAPSTKLSAATKYYGAQESLLNCLLHGRNYYQSHTELPGQELQIFTLSSLDFQKQLLTYGTFFIVLMLLISIFITFRISSVFTDRNLVAIDEAVEAAKHIGQGDLDYQLSTQNFDEFQILNDALNTLARDLKKLDQEKQELNRHKQILEMKQLKNQFNPHFVFNTLESIRYSIILNPQVAAEMTHRLSRLLRYSMDSGNGDIDLKTDLDFIENYLSLQKMRFGDSLDYSMEIDPELLDYRLPKHLLQPIVENCLNHGTRHSKSIFILLKAKYQTDGVHISVKDNGNGIDSQTMKALLDSIHSETMTTEEHFGLFSVSRTIQLIYGEEYGLSIDSEPANGTCVTLRLPPVNRD